MIIKNNTNGKQSFVYEFFTSDKYATSFTFELPSMGIWTNHEHPWIVIMRETSRCVTSNWSDLNDLLSRLIVFEKQFPGKWPSKATLMEWLESYTTEENYTFGWFNYPTDMEEQQVL